MGTGRRLTLLRHGKAHPADRDTEDSERTLTRRGMQDAEEMARRLIARDLAPELIVASPAVRAWTTAEILARACALPRRRLLADERLYMADPATIWRIATGHGDGTRHVLICAHNPGLSDLASRFGPRPETRQLATAGLASAFFSRGGWDELDPEDAERCELDDPGTAPGAWRRRAQP